MCHDSRELFRIAKQRVREKKDVVGVSCLKDESGVVKVSVDDQKKIWKEHMEKLMNVDQKKVVEKVHLCCDSRELFQIAKQRVREKKDAVGVSCLKDESGVVKVSVDDQKKIWKEHMEKLMNVDQKKVVEKVHLCRDSRELFQIAKQRVGEKKDVVGVSCLKDESGVVKVSVDEQKKIWKEHMEKLMNVDQKKR